jgi:hypothetical protein
VFPTELCRVLNVLLRSVSQFKSTTKYSDFVFLFRSTQDCMKSRCVVIALLEWILGKLERPLLSIPGCDAFVTFEKQTCCDLQCNICLVHEEINTNVLLIPNQNVNRRLKALVSEISNCNIRVVGLNINLRWSSPKVAFEERLRHIEVIRTSL